MKMKMKMLCVGIFVCGSVLAHVSSVHLLLNFISTRSPALKDESKARAGARPTDCCLESQRAPEIAAVRGAQAAAGEAGATRERDPFPQRGL